MPEWNPDFGAVSAETPVYPAGDYEFVVDDLRASAYDKTDTQGNITGHNKVVYVIPKVVGRIDSKGKLSPKDSEGKVIEGQPAERIGLWLHSEGGVKFSKRIMMAIFGYKGREGEKQFNEEIVANSDFSFNEEETEDGYDVTLGSGWDQLKGLHFRVSLDKEMREVEGREPVEQQAYKSYLPAK